MNYYTMRDDVASIKTNCAANIVKMTEMNLLIGKKFGSSEILCDDLIVESKKS